MSEENEKKLTPEEEKAKVLEDFLCIKDMDNNVLYKTSLDELEQVVSDVLSIGNFTKSFTLLGGKLELVYTTVLEEERQNGYEQVRLFTQKNENASRIQIETYTSKVNIALHTVRVVSNNVPTNLSTGKFEERMMLLKSLPEPIILALDKYLRIFLQLVNKAFNSEDVIKN